MSQQSHSTRSAVDQWVGAFSRNPEGLLLLAAGAALLLRKTASSFGVTDTVQRYATPGVNSVKKAAAGAADYASGMVERTKESVGSAAASASDYAGGARRAMGQQSERVMQNAQSAVQGTVERVLKDQPLLVALAGLAAGVAVATAFPATDFEKETLGPVGEQVSDAASRVGDQLKEAALKAKDTLKSAVEERGLNTDGLKDVATEVAQAFGSTMKGETAKTPREPGRGQ